MMSREHLYQRSKLYFAAMGEQRMITIQVELDLRKLSGNAMLISTGIG